MVIHQSIHSCIRRFIHPITLSNPDKIKPATKNGFYTYSNYDGWGNGYPFKTFLADFNFFIGEELAKIDGMQQLCHHYYLQNGKLDAKTSALRAMKFIGESK